MVWHTESTPVFQPELLLFCEVQLWLLVCLATVAIELENYSCRLSAYSDQHTLKQELPK